ncbi:hypothetical protein EWM64_g6744 [Hericium alpestre]|uniref:Uncharacterized protein n=1 Tax=Hericium alpestre TaxID=135208 RepID=A0A4Y9ZQU3_9AGAM|nr:hypothetical protein EWM64_g6744 [Hericium alpestre]
MFNHREMNPFSRRYHDNLLYYGPDRLSNVLDREIFAIAFGHQSKLAERDTMITARREHIQKEAALHHIVPSSEFQGELFQLG